MTLTDVERMNKVNITVFKWAGSWGLFTIKIPCGECVLTENIILDTMANELTDIPTKLDEREWLSEWWKPLKKGGWHAPIIMVENTIISQGVALNRGLLIQAVVEHHSRHTKISGNHVFGKENCPYCVRAKDLLNSHNISYQYHDVIKDSRSLYEMLARVKPIIGSKTPLTVPQIWLNSEYIGGADPLSKAVNAYVEHDDDR